MVVMRDERVVVNVRDLVEVRHSVTGAALGTTLQLTIYERHVVTVGYCRAALAVRVGAMPSR
ncbi:MAG: hypothetical protein ACKV2O_17725 [Acidimicrobiales bacterium]